MRLAADQMLRGLGRWSRVAGHDTLIAEPGEGDTPLLARSRSEGRVLLTRDRALAGRAEPDAAGAVPERALALDGPLRRCPACGRLYWPGSHVRRMQARSDVWAREK